MSDEDEMDISSVLFVCMVKSRLHVFFLDECFLHLHLDAVYDKNMK